jgi:hypothetical protein
MWDHLGKDKGEKDTQTSSCCITGIISDIIVIIIVASL